ncbi:MAG: hypothetical protein AB8F95_02660, partial [Bacteroidia bacterium]
MKKILLSFICCAVASLSFGQLYTGNTLQFGTYTGPIGIGAPVPGLFTTTTNLYVARTTAGAAIVAGNSHNGTDAVAIGATSTEGNALEALTINGNAIRGQVLNGTGYAGYFDGRVNVEGNNLTNPALSSYNSTGTSIYSETANGTALSAAVTGTGYAGRFTGGPVELGRVNALLSTGSLSFYADATPSDGASMSLWPNSDPGGSGDIALQTGTNGETRFERYDAPNSSYIRNMTIKNDGKISIGTNTNTSTSGYRLFVQDGIMTGRVTLDQAWADYVFDEDYTLPALDSVETFIEQNGHLPNIPSQTE